MSRRVSLAAVMLAACMAAGAGGARAAQPEPPLRPSVPADVQPPPQGAPRTKPTSDRCNTPAMNCILSDRQPRGSSCWCATPFGPSYGRVP